MVPPLPCGWSCFPYHLLDRAASGGTAFASFFGVVLYLVELEGVCCFPPPPFDDHPTLVEYATTTAASERRDLGSLNEQSQQVLSSDTASQLHKCLSVGNQNKAVQERQAAADGRLRQRCLATAKAPGGATYCLWCVALSPKFHLCRCLVKVTSNCRRREPSKAWRWRLDLVGRCTSQRTPSEPLRRRERGVVDLWLCQISMVCAIVISSVRRLERAFALHCLASHLANPLR